MCSLLLSLNVGARDEERRDVAGVGLMASRGRAQRPPRSLFLLRISGSCGPVDTRTTICECRHSLFHPERINLQATVAREEIERA